MFLALDINTLKMLLIVNYGLVRFATIAILFFPGLVVSHGILYHPPQRGVTNGNHLCPVPIYDKTATIDYSAHFPAGSKALKPGAGKRSQIKAAGARGWIPYEPMKSDFRFRAGVCGDRVWGREHLRGGKFYNDGKIFKTYREGNVISLDVAVTTHHNGFFVFHICDVAKCGDEIGKECFRKGHCHLLHRAWDKSCESRHDKGCAPIDPNHPWRWYLPCPSGRKVDLYGDGKMLYKLPKDLQCSHCVLQWYWATANTCNPPGLVAYFKSDRAPEWGDCDGQGNGKGGWRRWERSCGGKEFAEEYYQCADIRILPKWNQPKKPNKEPKAWAISEEENSESEKAEDAEERYDA